MKPKKISVDIFNPTKDDLILLDTNVLLDLFYPIDIEENHFDELYSRLRSAKSNLFITSIQLSEFINRCIRFQFQLYKDNQKNKKLNFKKDYRPTADYREKMNAILDIVKTDIVSNFQFINDDLENMDKNKIFLYGFSYDFNDALLAEIARKRNAIVVTNDIDFGNCGSDITIVTNNKLLLSFR